MSPMTPPCGSGSDPNSACWECRYPKPMAASAGPWWTRPSRSRSSVPHWDADHFSARSISPSPHWWHAAADPSAMNCWRPSSRASAPPHSRSTTPPVASTRMSPSPLSAAATRRCSPGPLPGSSMPPRPTSSWWPPGVPTASAFTPSTLPPSGAPHWSRWISPGHKRTSSSPTPPHACWPDLRTLNG